MKNEEKRSIIKAEMRPDEKLLWSGEPDPLRVALPVFAIWVFGVPWTAFSIFWMAMAFGMGHAANANQHTSAGISGFFPFFGLPFVLIGVALLSSPLFAYNTAKRTVYGISDQRAVIITGTKTRKVDSYDTTNTGQIQRIERPDKSGTLYFAFRFSRNSDGNQSVSNIGFVGIPDVRTVEQLLRETFSHSASHIPDSPRTPLR